MVLKGVDPETGAAGERGAAAHRRRDRTHFAPDADGIPARPDRAHPRRGPGYFGGRLRHADEPAGQPDAFWHAAALAAISGHGNFRFRILRLRRELGIRDTGLGAGAGRNRRRGEPAGSAGDEPRRCAARWPTNWCGGRARGFTATTWMDENRALFRALSLEKLVTALFIGLITFVAGLNILVVLTMTVTDRAQRYRGADGHGREAAADAQDFCAAGAGGEHGGNSRRAGWRLSRFSWVANRWRLIPLNPEVYAIPYVPFHANGLDAIWIAAAALAISIAATVLPARSAHDSFRWKFFASNDRVGSAFSKRCFDQRSDSASIAVSIRSKSASVLKWECLIGTVP